MQVRSIQDDGNRFIIHGDSGVAGELQETMDNMAMGVTVTSAETGRAHVLYTENNRDLVLNVLRNLVE